MFNMSHRAVAVTHPSVLIGAAPIILHASHWTFTQRVINTALKHDMACFSGWLIHILDELKHESAGQELKITFLISAKKV